jgi:atypical dual specificity phosphatase
MSASPSVLELSEFGVCFGRRVVLGSVDLSLPATGIDVLMGPVKAGKSTLMRSLAGLNDAAALYRSWGTATLDGRPVSATWRPALVQQHAAALNAPLRDALVLHARQQGERSGKVWAEVASAALTRHGLAHLLPQLDQSVLALPLEWQRAINVLSYALTEPHLLMIDEPTYGLDDRAAERFIDWLAALGKSCKLMVTLHHQGQARRLADRVTLLAGGRILAHGPAEQFFARPPNAWAEQFVRTGSLAIASPGARLEDLSSDAEAPPPLPQAALDALAEFDEAQPAPDPLAVPAPATVPAAIPVAPAWANTEQADLLPAKASDGHGRGAAQEASSSAKHAHGAKVLRPQRAASPAKQKRVRAVLPPLSVRGVEDAVQVGRSTAPDYRGPPGFNWIIAGKLAGCAEPGVMASIDYDMDLLARMGITYLITLTEKDLPPEPLARHGLRNLHLPIYDREAPTIRQVYMLVRKIQVLLDEGQIIAVHCKAGIGRTGTVLAAWLIREGGLSADAAIKRLRTIKSTYVQSQVQEQFLDLFEKDILQRQ